VLWVTLSTAEGGQADKLTYHHKQLRQRIERQLGFRGLEYYQVRTEEGHGVLHIFWAWRVPDGERARRFWISQEWLSAQWQSLHGAPVVWIKAYQPGHRSRNRLSRYVISQYVQDQSGYVNMCWSWKRSLGFPHEHAFGKRCAINGRAGMPFAGFEGRDRNPPRRALLKPGRTCSPGMPSGLTVSFCNWS
jgi:hypothetical protein